MRFFKKLDARGFAHHFVLVAVVLVVAIGGTYLLVAGHADTPCPDGSVNAVDDSDVTAAQAAQAAEATTGYPECDVTAPLGTISPSAITDLATPNTANVGSSKPLPNYTTIYYWYTTGIKNPTGAKCDANNVHWCSGNSPDSTAKAVWDGPNVTLKGKGSAGFSIYFFWTDKNGNRLTWTQSKPLQFTWDYPQSKGYVVSGCADKTSASKTTCGMHVNIASGNIYGVFHIYIDAVHAPNGEILHIEREKLTTKGS